MNWDTYNTKNITEKYVYRYLTIEKLVDFLISNSIYLSRLDTFEDNLESIEPYDINELQNLTLQKPINFNPLIANSEWDERISASINQAHSIQKRLGNKQKKAFVSCWILSDVESFAMWDIYGKSGFAIRFEMKYFQDLIRESIKLQVDTTKKIDLLVAGEVRYQNFDTMIDKEKESLLKYSVFRKHLSFKHEAEYRVVGFTNTIENEIGLRFKLPNLDDINLDLFANPRLTSFQFNQFNDIISKYSKKHNLKESELKRWLEFRNIIFKDKI